MKNLYSSLTFFQEFVVVGIVISFVGDALKSLLENRKQLILVNIQEAENREKEAIRQLQLAKENFEKSKQKAIGIRDQSIKTAGLEQQKYQKQIVDDIQRLHKVKDETIVFQQQQAIKQITQRVINLAFQQVYSKLENRYDSVFQNSVNNFYIALFRNYQPK